MKKIGDYVQVRAQPTVIRLEQLFESEPGWISASYYVTEEVGRYLESLRVLLSKDAGCGVFVIGHYGSGKSHFLAYVTQQLQAGALVPEPPAALPISLLHFTASRSLESIVSDALGLPAEQSNRKTAWSAVRDAFPQGLLLILDELSEFLRSKPTLQSFNEDLRFLQFLGEWSQGQCLWILATLQEQIEHTGDMEYDLYRKIKDRYPVRYLLSPGHVKDLLAHRILEKKDSYGQAVHRLVAELMEIYPGLAADYADLAEIYPIHPATLQLLEEVRDRFSQARGVVDFALTQLLGNAARGVAPFLEQPWGRLLTPDAIVDHFADLFEVQPEYLAVAQKLLPYFRKQIPAWFENKAQQELAWRLVKLLILVHLSPRRKALDAEKAAEWLLLKVSSIDPARNREVLQRMLETMAAEGAFIKRRGGGYALDFEDTSAADVEHLLARTLEEIKERGDTLFETLAPLLEGTEFNPFDLPRERWQPRKVRWHFHDRDVHFCLGAAPAPGPQQTPAVQIGLPWGSPPEGRRCFRVDPARLEMSPELLELAALCMLGQRLLPAPVSARLEERVSGRRAAFAALFRSCYARVTATNPDGVQVSPPLDPMHGGWMAWLNAFGEWALRQTYPLFERFSPGSGPLPREAYRTFMKYAAEQDLGAEDAPDYVKLIREAYLVPMGLMQRRGSEYQVHARLDNHELVRFLAPVLEHHPSPARVYEHLSAPVYGLVADQIQLLLTMLVLQGEIDIVKGQHSYRDSFETLIDPLQYDRILPGHALQVNQLRDLQALCEGLQLRVPKQWTVLAEKRAIEQLRQLGRKHRDQLSEFLTRLQAQDQAAGELETRIERLMTCWSALDKGENEFQAFQHFLHALISPQRFAADVKEIMSLPARYDKLMREAQRFRHLFGYPCLRDCPAPEIAAEVEALAQQPVSIDQPEALEDWLQRAQSLYGRYQGWYRSMHDRYWKGISAHRLWSYSLPQVAKSKHLLLGPLAEEVEAAIRRARSARCTGLSALEFQPLCRCGFDGREAPASEMIRQFEDAVLRLEQQLELFFQQDRVKARVRDWVHQGFEVHERTLSYLEGKETLPEVDNVALFDQHLAGLEIVQPVPADKLLDYLGEGPWEQAALRKAFDEFFSSLGPRVALRRQQPPSRAELAAWCCRQALQYGAALPPGLSAEERRLMTDLLEPQWVGQAALQRLEQLNLPEEAVLRVLDLLLDGLVTPPGEASESAPVAAAVALQARRLPQNAAELADWARLLYSQNERLLKLRPEHWLDYLNRLAEVQLQPQPAELVELLQSRRSAQWMVVDCLGLALLPMAREVVASSFPQWKIQEVAFARTSERSSTDAFYRSLLDGAVKKSFLKINAVDTLVHQRRISLGDLERLARAELEVAFRRVLPELNPEEPLVLFADHGFRLDPEGRTFVHGGSSTLERVVPVIGLCNTNLQREFRE